MDRSLKILLACGTGAFIGSLIALDMSKNLWWVGLPFGILVGYISYDFKEALNATSMAFRKTYGEMNLAVRSLSLKNFSKAIHFISELAYLITCLAIIIALSFLDALTFSFIFTDYKHPVLMLFGTMAGIISLGVWLGSSIDMANSKKRLIIGIFYLSLLGISYRLAQIIMITIRIGLPFLWKFSKNFFVIIHSNMRLLCGIDAAIGTGIGYFSGSAVIGALAGGIFGVINYEIVSKRILKVQPKVI